MSSWQIFKEQYAKELAYRRENKTPSADYKLQKTAKEINNLNKALQTAKENLTLRETLFTSRIKDLNDKIANPKTTEKDLQKALAAKSSEEASLKVAKDAVDIAQAKVDNPVEGLYGADLLDEINKRSHTRFGFGKKTEAELNSETSLQSNYILEPNDKPLIKLGKC